MPRDPRLYMTFPIDFHRHPKLTKLPIDVRWTFIEMNGEARLADNDGSFSEEDAEFMWPREHLDALVGSHPSRPLVTHSNGMYVIREYAEHQETKATRAARAEKNRANGARGGRPRKNPTETQSVASGLPMGTDSQANQTQHKAESESESELEDLTKITQSQSSSNRARDSTDDLPSSPFLERLATMAGLTDVATIVAQIERHTGRVVTGDRAIGIGKWLLEKAKEPPKAPQRYVLRCIAMSPFEIQQHIDGEVA